MHNKISLRTGDKVQWQVGLNNSTKMVGVVLEDLNDGNVNIFSHTKNGSACVLEMTVERSKLTLVY